MIKVVPYSLTSGNKKFCEFLSQPFTIDMLCPVTSNLSIAILFEGWKGKNMRNWYKFTNDNDVILEFYPDYYVINKPVGKLKIIPYQLPLPHTINDFVNDMHRLNIQLYWTQWIDNNFEPKDYLNVNEIEEYYRDLLGRMGKSHELL